MFKILSDIFQFQALKPVQAAAHHAHLVVDCQRLFADPRYYYNLLSLSDHDTPQSLGTGATAKAAGNIARLMPVLRASGVPTIVSYLDEFNLGAERAWGGFYKIETKPEDILVPKAANSAFENTPLLSILREKDIRHLLVSGFTAEVCVKESISSALDAGFEVTILKDCVGQVKTAASTAEDEVRKIEDLGARALTMKEALAAIRVKPGVPAYGSPSP